MGTLFLKQSSRWPPIPTWSDNYVRELATTCLPWQHWTKALVWFDDAHQRFTAVLCWYMAVSFWVASVIVCVWFGVLSRECRSL